LILTSSRSIHPGRARLLLTQGKAAVFRHQPFTIILKQPVVEPRVTPVRLKIDPGAKTTGLALVDDGTGEVVWAAELEHRGFQVRASMTARSQLRRNRRTRKTRHRQERWRHRTAKYQATDRLPPSLYSRLANVMTWVERLRRWCPVAALSMELVRFDIQKLENPNISGVEYQQGTLAGYELREYLLEKWGRQCAYCHKKDVVLQVEHVIPKSRLGASNRVYNLCIACGPCNQRKGTMTAAEFGHPEVQATARQPLAAAAALNVTRWALWRCLTAKGLPLETGSGGQTKFNRAQRNLPKEHWLDAVCVGASTPTTLRLDHVRPLEIRACGRGSRLMASSRTKQGFPIAHRQRARCVRGFRAGDIVLAHNPSGKHKGRHCGRLSTVRANGSGRIGKTYVHLARCHLLQKADGYTYAYGGSGGLRQRL
jgi:5-methylcytosine-specific restriction endonuclease McrA